MSRKLARITSLLEFSLKYLGSRW